MHSLLVSLYGRCANYRHKLILGTSNRVVDNHRLVAADGSDLHPRSAACVSALQGILYALETQQPLLFIDNLELSARLFRPRLPNNEIANYTRVQLNAQFEVSGYLPREGG